MTVGRVRAAITDLPAYRPGKGAAQAEAEHGITNAIKLASNENPYPPHPAIVQAISEAAAGVNRYGDHRASELRERLGGWLGVDTDQVAVGCGSVGLLQQLCLTFVEQGSEVLYPWPSFEAYPINVKMMGGIPVNPPLTDHAIDLDLVAGAITDKTSLILLATPNNPTGTALSVEQLSRFMGSVPDDVVVLVDEAYFEFRDTDLGDPVSELLPHHRNIVVTRTFSKAYGMAGLRSGYAIADAEVIAEIDKSLIPFSVNSLSQAAALAALDNLAEIQTTLDLLKAERTRVVAELEALGWSLPDAQANFVYLPLGDRTDEIALAMEREGVVTRAFSTVGCRVTISTPEENDRFLAAFAKASQ